MSEINFPCTSCGICCRKLGLVIDEYRKRHDFPYNVNPDGSCEMLLQDGRCAVYDSRPDCCSIKKVYEKDYKDLMTRKEFYLQNSMICNQWMDEAGMDKDLRIDLKQYDINA